MFKDFYFNVKLDDVNAKMPSVAYEGDAGFDLYASEQVVLEKGKRYLIPVGIRTEFPFGYVALVRDRGSGTRTHVVVAGVIDAGYRGHWFVQVYATADYTIEIGEKVAQFLILPVFNGNLTQVLKLNESERGEKRLGSSNFK